jgi:tRNA threonylcarbamoyladenosine biosynthesis protein TsaB
MNILAIDTSCSVATVALMDETKTLAEFTINNKITHSEHLLSMIHNLFELVKIDIADIDYIACSTGPGSFTGLRIGVATSKGLAHALNKKIVPVPTLDALAYNIFDTSNTIVPIMDARRNHVYTASYKWNDNFPHLLTSYKAQDIDLLLSDLKIQTNKVIFCGDGVLIHKDKILDAGYTIAPTNLNMQKASSVGSLAFHFLSQHKEVTYSDFKPFYLKITQAEREYEKKKLNDINKTNELR